MGSALSILHSCSLMSWSGETNRVLTLSKGLVQHGCKVIIACRKGALIGQRAREMGLQVYDEFGFPRPLDPRFLHDLLRLQRLVEEENVEILHTHDSQDSWAGAFLKKRMRRELRLVRTRHNSFPVPYSFLNRWLYSQLDALILTADALREIFSPFIEGGIIGEDKLTVIHSAVDMDRFSRACGGKVQEELGIGEDEKIVIVASRISHSKGIDVLLKAAKLVAEKFPGVHFLILGEGEEKDRFISMAEQLGLGGIVHFLGFRENVEDFIAASSLLVLPSRGCDASPGAVKEAMAAGKPCVATDVGGVREIVEDGVTGFVVPPEDEGALANAILRLLEDEELAEKFGRLGAQRVAEKFSTKALVEATLKLYRKVVGKG